MTNQLLHPDKLLLPPPPSSLKARKPISSILRFLQEIGT